MLIIKEIRLEDSLSWDQLIRDSNTASFFQTKEWLRVWCKHFPSEGSEVKIIGVFDGDNLLGVAPLEISENSVNFLGINPVLGGELVSDFGDIIIKSGREKEVWENLIRQCLADSQSIALNFIREDSPSFKILQELGGEVKEIDVAPYIDLPGTWDEYLNSLARHDRHELRRKMRKIAEEGAIMTDYRGDDNDSEEFFALMVNSNERKKNFLTPEMKLFFHEVIKTFYPDKLALSFLKSGKNYIAGVLTFLFKDEVLLYNSGFDSKYANLAAGLILKAYLIKKAIETGKKKFDFLRGGERYKYDLGGKERKLYKVTF